MHPITMLGAVTTGYSLLTAVGGRSSDRAVGLATDLRRVVIGMVDAVKVGDKARAERCRVKFEALLNDVAQLGDE